MPAKTPFSEDEKDLVQDLAWEKLCTEFNSRPFVRPRDVKQLKKLWDNMKQRWEREKAKQIHDVLTTRGGPPPPPMGEKLAQIEAIVPHLTTRVPDPLDSDRPPAMPAAQSESEILNGMICENGPADSDEGMPPFCELHSAATEIETSAGNAGVSSTPQVTKSACAYMLS
ncbi:hypothetical protein MRX96_025803 [Rhipicephalus microplus]